MSAKVVKLSKRLVLLDYSTTSSGSQLTQCDLGRSPVETMDPGHRLALDLLFDGLSLAVNLSHDCWCQKVDQSEQRASQAVTSESWEPERLRSGENESRVLSSGNAHNSYGNLQDKTQSCQKIEDSLLQAKLSKYCLGLIICIVQKTL